MSVVRYTPDLFPRLCSLARAMHDEVEIHKRPVSVELFRRAVEHDGSYCALYQDAEGEFQGFLLGELGPDWLSGEIGAADKLLYVTPQARGGFAAVRLVQDFERWAAENGAKDVILAQATGVRVPETTALYERLGYTIIGSVTRKVLQ